MAWFPGRGMLGQGKAAVGELRVEDRIKVHLFCSFILSQAFRYRQDLNHLIRHFRWKYVTERSGVRD